MHIAAVKGSDWIVAVSGVKDVEFNDVDTLLSRIQSIAGGTQFQLFNADFISGWEHLYFAAVNALNAFNSGAGISRSLALEILLFASCQDQISSAFSVLGIKPGDRNVAVLVLGTRKDDLSKVLEDISEDLGIPDDGIIELTDMKRSILKKTYGISENEIASVQRDDALTWLIIERGALLRR